MNCNPGDLAVVVGASCKRNLGRIVQCVRLHNDVWHDIDGVLFDRASDGPSWVVDPPLESEFVVGAVGSTQCFVCEDRHLRPIRDNDQQDETLTWAGKPQEVAA